MLPIPKNKSCDARGAAAQGRLRATVQCARCHDARLRSPADPQEGGEENEEQKQKEEEEEEKEEDEEEEEEVEEEEEEYLLDFYIFM